MEDRELAMEILGCNDFKRNLIGATIGCRESQRRGIVVELKLVDNQTWIYIYVYRKTFVVALRFDSFPTYTDFHID